MGRYEEGGRALKLFHRSPKDLEALPRFANIVHDHRGGDDRTQHVACACWVADRLAGLGSSDAACVRRLYPVYAAAQRTDTETASSSEATFCSP